MSEILSFILLVLISASISIFITGMIAVAITRRALQLYYRDSKAGEKLVDACKKNDLATVKYIIEPSRILGTSVLDESNISKDTLFYEAFLAAIANNSILVINYLINKPMIIKYIKIQKLPEISKEICHISNVSLIYLFLTKFKDELEEAFESMPTKFVEAITCPDNLSIYSSSSLNFNFMRKMEKSDILFACCKNNSPRLLKHILDNLDSSDIIDFEKGFKVALYNGSISVVEYYIENQNLHKFCTLDPAGIMNSLEVKSNITSLVKKLLQLPNIRGDYGVRIEVINLIIQKYDKESNIAFIALLESLLCDEIPTNYILPDDCSILATAFFIVSNISKAWKYTIRLHTKTARAQALLESTIINNKIIIMNNISEIPTEFSIELFCNTTLEQHILNAENIVSFIEKVLFKHPDIEGYKKGRISQGDFTNRVLNNGLTTEKHKALCLLAPDQFTIAAIRNLRIRYSRDLLTQRKLEVNNLGVLQPF